MLEGNGPESKNISERFGLLVEKRGHDHFVQGKQFQGGRSHNDTVVSRNEMAWGVRRREASRLLGPTRGGGGPPLGNDKKERSFAMTESKKEKRKTKEKLFLVGRRER